MSTQRIKEMPEWQRPREKMARGGARTLSDAELLAIFFRSGRRGVNAIEMAGQLLSRFETLQNLSRCREVELQQVPGIGPAKAAELLAVFEIGRRLARERMTSRPIDEPGAVYELLGPELQARHRESLWVVLLNTRHHLIRTEEVSLGSVNESIAHPREILRPALLYSAYALILVHNHPSGDPRPSRADRALTRRLKEASELVEIKLLDHVIIGRSSGEHEPYFSFSETGLL